MAAPNQDDGFASIFAAVRQESARLVEDARRETERVCNEQKVKDLQALEARLKQEQKIAVDKEKSETQAEKLAHQQTHESFVRVNRLGREYKNKFLAEERANKMANRAYVAVVEKVVILEDYGARLKNQLVDLGEEPVPLILPTVDEFPSPPPPPAFSRVASLRATVGAGAPLGANAALVALNAAAEEILNEESAENAAEDAVTSAKDT